MVGGSESSGGGVHVLFVIDPVLWDGAGAARRGWLAANVRAAASYDGRLAVRVGDPVTKVNAFASEVGASSVHVSAETTPYGTLCDRLVHQRLEERGIEWVATGSPYAVGPGRVTNQEGAPYRVFMPFAKAWCDHGWADPAPTPRRVWFGDDLSDEHGPKRRDRALDECPADLPVAPRLTRPGRVTTSCRG